MTLRLHVYAIALALGSLIGLAGCGDDDDDEIVTDEMFDDIDLNGDGFIDANEWAAAQAAWDINGDGLISETSISRPKGSTTSTSMVMACSRMASSTPRSMTSISTRTGSSTPRSLTTRSSRSG